MESFDIVLELTRRTLFVAAELSLPVLLVGLLVALVVSIIQTMTQVQDQTVSVVPKMLGMGAAVFLLLPWLLSVVAGFARDVLGRLGNGLQI